MANLRLGFSKLQCVVYHKKRRRIGRLSPDRQVDEVDARLRVFRAHITEKPPQQRNLHRTVLAPVIGSRLFAEDWSFFQQSQIRKFAYAAGSFREFRPLDCNGPVSAAAFQGSAFFIQRGKFCRANESGQKRVRVQRAYVKELPLQLLSKMTHTSSDCGI